MKTYKVTLCGYQAVCTKFEIEADSPEDLLAKIKDRSKSETCEPAEDVDPWIMDQHIIGADGPDGEVLFEDVSLEDAAENTKPNGQIVIEGGALVSWSLPPDVVIEVRDYDVNPGDEHPGLKRNEQGDLYQEIMIAGENREVAR